MKNRILSLLLVLVLALSLVPSAFAAQADGVRVAVIDTGISTAAVSPASIADGANYIRPQDDTGDKLGHGTAVSAIIVGSEAARVTGICPTATLVPLVYCSKNSEGLQVRGDTAMVAQAIYDAIDVYHCDIINISSGSTGGSNRLKEAVEYAEQKGVLVVSSAGNAQETNPGAVYYPGGYETAICVGAANSDGTIAAFSQQNDTVDLLALGTDLGLASIKGTRIRGEGTSFATAIVTGAAAQIWAEHPELTADEVREILLDSTRSIDGWPVFDLKTALAWGADDSPFTDVAPGDDCYDAVCWSAANGIVNGVTPTTFVPNGTMTRAQMVTILWRAQGCPEPTTAVCPFTDVNMDSYYGKAVLWAVEQGLTNGTTPTTFAPNQDCTRAHMVTLLYRLSGQPAVTGEGTYTDVADGTWYHDTALWGAEQGIVTETGEFFPNQDCTRAQMVIWLFRWAKP